MSDNESLKYRVVGALVVIVSLALAWSILLEHNVQRDQDWTTSDIPEPMKIERFDVPRVEPIEDVETPKVTKVTLPEEKKEPVEAEKAQEPVAKQPTKPSEKDYTKLGKDGLPEAWVLQVGSFSARENAIALQSKLRKDDLPAYVKAFKLENGVKYRVLVGPKLDKAEAEKMAKTIKRKQKLNPMLMRFKPGYSQ